MAYPDDLLRQLGETARKAHYLAGEKEMSVPEGSGPWAVVAQAVAIEVLRTVLGMDAVHQSSLQALFEKVEAVRSEIAHGAHRRQCLQEENWKLRTQVSNDMSLLSGMHNMVAKLYRHIGELQIQRGLLSGVKDSEEK